MLEEVRFARAAKSVRKVVTQRPRHGETRMNELLVVNAVRARAVAFGILGLRNLASRVVDPGRLRNFVRLVILRQLLYFKLVVPRVILKRYEDCPRVADIRGVQAVPAEEEGSQRCTR